MQYPSILAEKYVTHSRFVPHDGKLARQIETKSRAECQKKLENLIYLISKIIGNVGAYRCTPNYRNLYLNQSLQKNTYNQQPHIFVCYPLLNRKFNHNKQGKN